MENANFDFLILDWFTISSKKEDEIVLSNSAQE